jgi:hypothetical protein
MAIELVPAGDPRCDVCAGKKDRPRPKPGERWSERAVVRTMCEACYKDFVVDLKIGEKITDPIRREVDPPEDPSQN